MSPETTQTCVLFENGDEASVPGRHNLQVPKLVAINFISILSKQHFASYLMFLFPPVPRVKSIQRVPFLLVLPETTQTSA